jgi:anti-sigma factor RsiW
VKVLNCKKALGEVSNYLDGELDEELKRTLEAHLNKCHKCYALFDTTQKTIEIYCDDKLFALPDDVRTRLHEALKRKLQGCK